MYSEKQPHCLKTTLVHQPYRRKQSGPCQSYGHIDPRYQLRCLKTTFVQVGTRSELLKEELTRWSSNYIDVNNLVLAKLDLEHKLDLLNAEIKTLR